jgi:hypothetical protein
MPIAEAASTGRKESWNLGAGWGIGLLVLAFLLRAWGIGGPYEHFDEKIAVQASRHLAATPGWDINWRVAVPAFSGTDQYNFSAYLYATHGFRRALTSVSGAERWRERDGLLAHRLFSACCATLVVGLVGLAGVRLGGGTLGFAAGLLAALNPQLVQDAHYARPEAFMTLLVVASVVLALGRITGPRLALAGGLIGLAAATKASNAALLMIPLVAAWDAATAASGRWWRPDWRQWLGLGSAGVAGGVAGWLAGVPYAVINWGAYRAGLAELAGQYAGSHPPFCLPDYRAVWPLMGEFYVATHGWPLLVAALAGGLWCVWRREVRAAGLLLLPLLAAICLFGSQRVFFERNLSVVLPGAVLLGAIGMQAVFDQVLQHPAGRRIALALGLALASLPGVRVAQRFLGEGVTDRVTAGEAQFKDQLGRDFPGVRLAAGSMFSEREFVWLRGELLSGRGELLYVLMDFNDAFKTRYLPELSRQFLVLPVAEYDGPFADYPTSDLNLFHGHRLRAYRIRERGE